MGNSYRSSSSSSSRSSSSSSYKPSYSSSSSSKPKDSSSSNSYSTSSGPTPSSYFDTTTHKIYVHFHNDGSADVQESFRIQKDQSKIGIKRPTFLIAKETEISNLIVLPETLQSSHHAGLVTLFWPTQDQNPEMEIQIHYQIKEAYLSLGTLALVNWRFSKTSQSSEPFQLVLTWDPDSFSKQLRIQKEMFNSSLLEYERKDLPISFETSRFELQKEENVETNATVVIDMPNGIQIGSKTDSDLRNQNPEALTEQNFSSHNSHYQIDETVTIKENGSHFYQSKIFVNKENPNHDSLQYQLGLNRFRESGETFWNHFWAPAFQISYGFEGLTTHFWHLFSVSLSEGESVSKNQTMYSFAYHTLGETSNRNKEGVERWIRITQLEKRENLELQSFSLRALCESGIDPKLSKMELVFTACEYCSDITNESSLVIPVEPKWESDGFSLVWNDPIPSEYSVYLRLREENKQITYNPFLIYYAVLNAFFHSPGSGNHMGHLITMGITSLVFLITGFVFVNRKKHQRSKKESYQTILSEIRKYDPNFDFSLFRDKVISVTEKTVSTWDKGNMEPARNFLSAAVFQRFSIQLHLMKLVDGEVNRMKDFSVVSVQIIDKTMESDYLTLHLKLKCKTKDKTFPKQTSELEIQNSLEKTSFSTYEEIHSYTRKLSTQTKPKIDLIHDLCPSCGASAKFSHTTNRCEYCNGIFNSGESDWVLTEITQMVEWDSARQSKLKNLPEGVAKQLLEDRAATVFWKYIHFLSTPNSQILHREATRESYQNLGVSGKEPMFTPVVGSCHLVGYESQSAPHQMTCEIRWSVARKKGLLPEHRRSHISLVLPKERPKTLGFSEMSCENCGAPLPEVDASECSHCQKPIPETVTDWLFHSIRMVSL